MLVGLYPGKGAALTGRLFACPALEPAVGLARSGATLPSSAGALVLCSHGDLIPAILDALHTDDGVVLEHEGKWELANHDVAPRGEVAEREHLSRSEAIRRALADFAA